MQKKVAPHFLSDFFKTGEKARSTRRRNNSFDISGVSIYIFVIPFLPKRSRNVALLHR